jgi:Cupin superfamily protein
MTVPPLERKQMQSPDSGQRLQADEFPSWLADYWGGKSAARGVLLDTTLPSDTGILAVIDCGLLSKPYVEVYSGGAMLPPEALFIARTVQNHSLPGFIHYRRIMQEFGAGATLRFPAIDDWLPDARPLARSVRKLLGGDVEASAYLAAGGASITLPDGQRDSALISCSGTVSLRLSAESVVQASPGDALYLPAGTIHEAIAGEDGCLFVILTNRELSTREFVSALQEAARAHLNERPEMRRHHLMTVEDRAEWVRSTLTSYFSSLEPSDFARSLAESV